MTDISYKPIYAHMKPHIQIAQKQTEKRYRVKESEIGWDEDDSYGVGDRKTEAGTGTERQTN